MSRLPPLNAVRAFVAASRHCSFKDAAAELCVTPGAISRQIQILEAHFGVALFERGHRAVRLTEQGARYFTRIAEPFAQLQEASEELSQTASRPTVRLDCVPTFAMHWLLPRLPQFQAAHPGIEVCLGTSVGPVDRSKEFDLAIRRDPAHFAGLQATRLMTEYCLPVCSPALPGRESLATPADLARFRIIDIRVRDDLWPTWYAAVGLSRQSLQDRLLLDQTFFAIQAAEDGLGVAMAPLPLVERQLSTGRLIDPLGLEPVVSGAYYAIHPPGGVPAATAPFLKWLAATATRWQRQAAKPVA